MSHAVGGTPSPFGPILDPVADQLPIGMRDQYLVPSDAQYEVLLGGQMERIWHRPFWLWPVFWLLSLGDVLFPKTGSNVPTTLKITALRDANGRSIAIWQRTFFFPHHKRRQYTSLMRYDADSQRVVELQGPRQIFQENAIVRFVPPSTIEWTTVESFIRVGGLRVRLPRRLWISARIVQRADADHPDASRVILTITHGLLGPIFGYEGTFRSARRDMRPPD